MSSPNAPTVSEFIWYRKANTHIPVLFSFHSEPAEYRTLRFKSANRVHSREQAFKYENEMRSRVAVSPVDKVSHLQP